MGKVVRFSVSLEKELHERFQQYIDAHGIDSRSAAISQLIRKALAEERIQEAGGRVASAIMLVYDHHKKELVQQLLDAQHDFQEVVISNVHVHLSHNDCFEIIIVRGDFEKIQALYKTLNDVRGLKLSYLSPPILLENEREMR